MSLSLVRSIAVWTFFAVSFAAPAAAEHWQLLHEVPGVRSLSLDLDSVHWDGTTVSYRVEIKTFRQGVNRQVIVASMINCEARERKMVASEEVLADGSHRKLEPLAGWQPIQIYSGIEQARHYFCDKP